VIANIVIAVLSVSVLALIFGVVLGYSAKKFAVKNDPKVEQILGILPGANCGGCGFAGCAVFASRVAADEASYSGCPPSGSDGAARIASFLGIETEASKKKSAYVKCGGTEDNIKRNYIYDGPKSCVAASQLAAGGNKSCAYSCIGLASCRNVCPFGAIRMVDSVAVINKEKCTACGKCVPVCPKNLIEIIPDSSKVRVLCNSRDTGRVVRENCRAGCLGCSLCKRNCPQGAITLENNVARIDPYKCVMCMKCVEKCPTKAIKIT